MRRNAYKYWVLWLIFPATCLFWGACRDEVDELVTPSLTKIAEVPVHLSVGAETMAGKEETRVLSPLFPDVENLIYDIWVLQYMKESNFATLIKSVHLRGDATEGVTSYDVDDVSLYPVDSYVCIIANRNVNTPSAEYVNIFDSPEQASNAQIFSNFRTTLVTIPVAAINSGEVNWFLMCGYWEGTPSANAAINVLLGRMMARLNVTIVNSAFGTSHTPVLLNFKIRNVPTKTYLFPSVNQNPLDWKDTKNYIELDELNVSLKKNVQKNLYYYVAPNYSNTEDGATKFDAYYTDNSGKEYHANVVLGTDAPGVANRDYNLYQNTIYSYTITLTK